MLSLVILPKLAAQFDARNQTFEHRFGDHSTFFRLVNAICATERSLSDAGGSAEFELALNNILRIADV